jgi:hypothetical protein
MRETEEFQKQVGRIDGLVHRLESAADPALRASVRELVECLMQLHGTALERMLEIVSSGGAATAGLIEDLSRDPLVSSVLVLYDLHPDDLETRVQRGLEKVRPMLRSQDARFDKVEIIGAMVHIRIAGAPSTDLQPAIREALLETAPDIGELVIEGGKPLPKSSGFVPLASLLAPALARS